MKKKFLLSVLCIGLILLSGCGNGKSNIRFGAAGIGGMYYSFASTFAGIVAGSDSGYTIEVKNTAGSEANLRLLSENYIQLAIAQNDLIYDAYYGTGSADEPSLTGYSAIAGLYPEACQLVVRKDSAIHSIDDLQGKTVSIGASESGTERNARQILTTSGLTDSLVTTVNLDYTEAASSLRSGEIDAFFCTAGIKTTVIEELTRECDIRLIGLDEKLRSRLCSAYPFYSEFTIPANTYAGQTEDIMTLSVQAVLLANNRLSDRTVQDLTEILFAHAQELQYSVAVDMELSETVAVSNVGIPFHPGAASYYADHGISVDTGKPGNKTQP